jgi:hypothetical protein
LLIGLGVFGLGRIVYLVAFAPHLIQSAPLLRFIIRLFARP